jgi:hypothetical protein
MSEEQPQDMGTKPIKEHEWLQRLVGEWTYTSEIVMEPGAAPTTIAGTASVKSLGGLWAFAENKEDWGGGDGMTSYFALGYDVSFKEYRGCWIGSVSSHLWNYHGTLSEDGNTMILDCTGPDMEVDGATAEYRDIIEIQDANHRTLTSAMKNEEGGWDVFVTTAYTRVS